MELGLEILLPSAGLGDPAASDEAIYQLFERNQSQIMGEYLKGLAEGGLVPPRLRKGVKSKLASEMTRIQPTNCWQKRIPSCLRHWREKLRAAGQDLNAVKDSIRLLNPTYLCLSVFSDR